MKLNNPLPQPLPKECLKAAKIFKSFVDSGNNGLDGVIPRSILENAKGFAIFTIFKAGFVFSARAGSGVVIAKLDDGTWSAPSAIGTAGIGVGGQLGAEVTDFLVVLNSRAAIRTFMAAGSLTLGGNVSIALGPLGRNGEASGSVNSSGKLAAMYSYSKTQGLFGGISIEGSVIVERQDANVQAYNSPVTARLLLGGSVDSPPWSSTLINTLESCTGIPGNRKWVEDGTADRDYIFGGVASPASESSASYLRKKKKSDKPVFPPDSWGVGTSSGSYFPPVGGRAQTEQMSGIRDQDNSIFEIQFESNSTPSLQSSRHPRFSQSVSYTRSSNSVDSANYPGLSQSSLPTSPQNRSLHTRSMSMASPKSLPPSFFASPDPFSDSPSYDNDTFVVNDRIRKQSPPQIVPKLEVMSLSQEGVARVVALYDFHAVEPGDLSFNKGDVITVTKKSDSNDDWWTGKLHGYKGIFPANFVEVI
ncbi:hypothetical protein BDZ94DRAFT_1225781 [Collybia nuda]|uniref:SH3 domain-containing protein n=1 Tax=Collybia nuda TaxID=64659 RepID=A0A9P5XVY4_9AGAR|nr:hypothetical protein BDZ94DRAFT_1225781 [Collybia nuda]